MRKFFTSRPLVLLSVGLCLGLSVGVGMMIGTITTMTAMQEDRIELPESLLHATATHGSDQFAVSTGPISSDVEGVFFLDFVTGDLTCLVMYPRAAKFGAKYSVNVVADLGIEAGKTPKYCMVTGGANFRANNTGNTRPATCVVYVVDANTGNFVAYGLPWNNNMANTGNPQGGGFTKLGYGKARDIDLAG